MAPSLEMLSFCVIIYCTSLFLCSDFCFACTFEKNDQTYNLSTLDWPDWQAVGKKNGSQVIYDISICRALNYSTSPENEICGNTSVCRHSNGTITEMGQFALTNVTIYDGVLQGGFMLFLSAAQCPSGTTGTKYYAIINFMCGATLGSPEVLMESECSVQFLWKTSAACKLPSHRNRVPCYVIDKEGNKRNLEGLGMHSVLSANPGVSISIDVCADLKTVGRNYCQKCPPKTAAIRNVGGIKHSIGLLGSKLEMTEEGLHIFYGPPPYTNDTLPEGCTTPPTTSIFFLCPERLKNRRPRVISDVDCQYEIEWETEYACPESMLKGDFKTCGFTKDVHGVDLDLSPLKKTDGPYKVTSQNATFVFNMCGGLGDYQCNRTHWASSAVCYEHGNSSEVIAITNNAKLMLAERLLTLKYEGPECQEGVKYLTVFTFSCKHDAENNGTGRAIHILSIGCTNFFLWETKYACLPYKPEIPCSVSSGGKYFDLRSLQKDHESVWNVLSPRTKDSDTRQLYYMNVCGPTFVSMPHTFGKCEGDPAVIRIENNTCINLGEFNDSPSYDDATQSLTMKYTNGSICKDNLQWSSVVEFKCYPGRFFSDVVLTHVNEAGCINEFEFRSSIACPSTVLHGKDCKLVDPDTGLNIDLTPLSSSVHTANSPYGKYYLSICGSLPKNNTCVNLLNSPNDVASCVLTSTGSVDSAQNLGAPSTQIGYVHGNVNLTYTGEKFNTIILFMCTVHGNNGRPVFSRLIRNTFVFHWYTDLVCPKPATTECFISNPETGGQYDFSGLSKNDSNWISHFTEEEGDKRVERKLYINICRSLNPAPSCDRDAAACIVTINGEKEDKYLPSVGRATSSLQLLSSDHLQLHYTDGKSCTAHGKNINYSTVVHFICSETDMARPKFIGKVGECQYSFLWTTKAACPLRMISLQNECVLTDPGTGFTFDLTSLSQNPYTVSAKNQTYKLSICNPVKSGCTSSNHSNDNISACEISQDGKITPLSTVGNFTLQYIERRHLILTYFNNIKDSETENSSEVIITMLCDKSAAEVQPVFVKKEDQRYYFELKTSLVCVEEVGNCNFRDSKGKDYDITTLFQSSKNWKVIDKKRDLEYHINFCRPLAKDPSYKYPGGAVGAAQIDLKSLQTVGVSLGVQLSEPTVSEDGSIIVNYTDGEFCKEGIRRSTHITLICSHIQGEMVFMGETSECEYLFSMNTPAACSAQTAVGQNCIVTDPVYGHTYNLNYIKNPYYNYTSSDGEYTYILNVCDKVAGFTGPCENAGVCQTKPDDPSFSKSLGLPSSKLMYSEGILTLRYDSGSLCHNKYNRSAVIKFTCLHPFGLGNGNKPYFVSEAEDCTYLFEWPTSFACPPFHLSQCSTVNDHGQRYDLSELMLHDSNYYVKNPMEPNQTFVINVCKSVVYSPGAICPYAAAACLLDPSNIDDSKRARNLGQVTDTPYFEDGKLVIKYTSGEPCGQEKGTSARFMETLIEFTCDAQMIKSEPRFVGRDVCTYYFTWSTAYACSLNEFDVKEGECIATDPYTGFEFDFSALKKEDPYIVRTPDHQYFLNICGDVKTSPCGAKSGAGVCQQELQGKRVWNAGKANAQLMYQDGVLFLNYSGGAACHNKKYQRNTIIHFHCNAGIGEPHFLYESSDCTYYFTWGTEYACQSLMHCAVKNGSSFFDLTPLTVYPYHKAENHVDNDDASYFLSVCSALTPHAVPASCPEGSAICRQSDDKGLNLGRVGYPPFVDFEGHATVIYTNGSDCPSSPGQQYKSRIIFMCDPDELLGKPVLVRVEEDICMYVFEWRTNIICPQGPTNTSKANECVFDDSSSGVHFDLSPLMKIGSYYEVNGEENGSKFLLNICGTVGEQGCSNSAVCFKETEHGVPKSFGTHSSEKIAYDGGRLRVSYTDGEDCPFTVGGKKSSEIILACDPHAGLGSPKLMRKKYTCLATFIWSTNLVCQDKKHPCDFNISNKEIDIYQLSSLSHNWKATDSENNTYFLNVCRGLNQIDEAKGCPTNAAVCMKQNNTLRSLGLIHSMTNNVTDSGELVLTYSSGSAHACVKSDSNMEQVTASSKITLKCGSSLGQPTFVSGPDEKCVYHFVWETNIVCEGEKEELVYEGNGTLIDKRLGYEMDLSTILDRTYYVSGISQGENYTYVVNIGQGYTGTEGDANNTCSSAAVCQTKPENKFYRDIGSVSSRRFHEKGSELYLSLISHTRGCGKNGLRNVTTMFILKCTSYAGDGSPVFMYESGGCDYIFTWDTNAICTVAHRRVSPTEIPPSAADNSAEGQVSSHSSSSPAVIIAVLSIILILCPIVYIVSKKERRSAAAAKIRSAFHRVTLPHFRYRRADGEMLILINGTQVNQSDAFKDDDLLS